MIIACQRFSSVQAVFIFSIAFFIWSFIIVLCRTMSNPFDLFKHNTTTNQLFVQVTQICNCISPIHIATIHTVFSKIFHKTIKRIFVIKTIRLLDLVKFSLKRTQSETFSASFCVLFYCLLLLPAQQFLLFYSIISQQSLRSCSVHRSLWWGSFLPGRMQLSHLP